jgi:hypothetical protein
VKTVITADLVFTMLSGFPFTWKTMGFQIEVSKDCLQVAIQENHIYSAKKEAKAVAFSPLSDDEALRLPLKIRR